MINKVLIKAKKINIKDGKRIIGLKSMALKEYLAARKLLNSRMLHQGAIFANTCLEKELKVLLLILGKNVSSNHETFKLFSTVLQCPEVDWGNLVNISFLKLISKIYKSRYFEVLNPGYNFVINQKKFLAELDYTFDLLESKTGYYFQNPNSEISYYQKAKKDKLNDLSENNYLIKGLKKEIILECSR